MLLYSILVCIQLCLHVYMYVLYCSHTHCHLTHPGTNFRTPLTCLPLHLLVQLHLHRQNTTGVQIKLDTGGEKDMRRFSYEETCTRYVLVQLVR